MTLMGKTKVVCFSISLDGYGAGPAQNQANPIGIRGHELHKWMFGTKRFRKMIGQEGGAEGIDNDIVSKSFEQVGAWIIGRNMFGPIRGDWPDDEWKGWWGEEPPYHVPVFVLTHHERASINMKGDTIFHFVTGGIDTAIQMARTAAGGKDVRVGGGVSTIRQFLKAGYIDEIQISCPPVFLGSGEHLFAGIDMPALGFNKIDKITGEGATHLIITKQQQQAAQ
jgi:dihydrofolate reductase